MSKYNIIRFYQTGKQMIIKSNVSLEYAQNHCQRDDTKGVNWFDGYEYCKRKEQKGMSKLMQVLSFEKGK